MPKIVSGDNLTEEQKRQILNSYISRDTIDSPWTYTARILSNKGNPTITDGQWLAMRYFEIQDNGLVVLKGRIE